MVLVHAGMLRSTVSPTGVSDDRPIDDSGRCTTPVGDTVDLSIPAWTNTIGASELGGVWTDPDFDPSLKA
ncbi:MAG: DUF3604 domain-containing protein, partial [Verrucomicrobiota bacterium]